MALTTDPGDVLLTFAEVAVAFAGFSSVVAIFQRSSSAGRESFDLFRFWVMLEFSLAALLFALLPFVLHFMGLGEPAVWSVGGLALIAFVLGHAVTTTRLVRRGEPAVVSSLTRGMSALANAAFAAILVSQALNLAGVLGRSFGPYLLGLSLVLFGAAVNFVRLVWVGSAAARR
jgi:hypothetical protein